MPKGFARVFCPLCAFSLLIGYDESKVIEIHAKVKEVHAKVKEVHAKVMEIHTKVTPIHTKMSLTCPTVYLGQNYSLLFVLNNEAEVSSPIL